MSFLFGKGKKEPPKQVNAFPPATRDIKSSDGPPPGSQIPTLNGVASQHNANGSNGSNNNLSNPARAQSPAAMANGPSVNGSLNSLAGNMERNPSRGPEDRANTYGSGPPSPDHTKSSSMRSGMTGQEVVSWGEV